MPVRRPLSLLVTSYAEDQYTDTDDETQLGAEDRRKHFLFSYCQHTTNFQTCSIPDSGELVLQG